MNKSGQSKRPDARPSVSFGYPPNERPAINIKTRAKPCRPRSRYEQNYTVNNRSVRKKKFKNVRIRCVAYLSGRSTVYCLRTNITVESGETIGSEETLKCTRMMIRAPVASVPDELCASGSSNTLKTDAERNRFESARRRPVAACRLVRLRRLPVGHAQNQYRQ